MVAKISFPRRVHDALNYNEQKMAKGVADLLVAQGYLRKPEDLNFYQKLEGLQQRNSLNDRASTHTIHVSLNFSPQDRQLDATTLQAIAKDYMQGIGFGNQPYLVYQHRDAGHPHLHIVSTTIRSDGSRIPTHNLGRDQSSRVRVELEHSYNLVAAAGRNRAQSPVSLLAPKAAAYGTEETRAAIARVVSYVFSQYAFQSLPEYNAALRQFGVVADRGTEESRIYRHGGLVYRVLDAEGKKAGVPFKASMLLGKPTLKALEQKYKGASKRKDWAKPALISKLDKALNRSTGMAGFTSALVAQGVFVLPRQNEGGRLYGITYVDNKTRVVCNGSELGKGYSAAAIQSRLLQNEAIPVSIQPSGLAVTVNSKGLHQGKHWVQQPFKTWEQLTGAASQPQETPPPSQLTKKRKRKDKRSFNL